MREIKFRAWYAPDKKMVYGRNYVCLTLEGKLVDGRCGDGYGFSNPMYGEELNAKNHILMQYTGLKDKNGKEIYEGDIIKKSPGFGCEWEPHICIVEWGYAGFNERRLTGHSFPLDDHDSGNEIVGNIYENSNLLETNKHHRQIHENPELLK